MLNIQNIIYINLILEELHIYKEVKNNKFNNILNIQSDFLNNFLYRYILNNINNIP